jgi:microcompartment protein CcmL/EutN
MPRLALGLIETSGIDGALKATRAASDSGQVVIVSAEQADSGRMTVKIEGEWVAVQGAVEAGARAAYQAGELVSMHVIPKPDQEVNPILPYSRFVGRFTPDDQPRRRPEVKSETPKPKPALVALPRKTTEMARRRPVATAPPPAQRSESTKPVPSALAATPPPGEQLEQMSVISLRRYARTVPNLPIKGREISRANKQQLLEAIDALRKTP